MAERQIDYRMKVLYALGVIFVAAGHCGYGGISLGYDWFVPHGFHLGLFMFISGYFYQPEEAKHPLTFIGRKARKLLIPLYLWNVIYGILTFLMRKAGFSMGEELSWYHLLVSPWTDGHQFLLNMGGWFVPSLFLCHALTALLTKVSQKLGCRKIWPLALLYLVCGIIGVKYFALGGYEGILLILLRLCYFLPFYGFGMVYREKLEGCLKCSAYTRLAVYLGLQLLLITWKKGVYIYYPAWGQGFENGIIPFVEGGLGILFWVTVAGILEPVLGRNKGVLALSKYGYDIMIHQFLGFMVLKTVLYGGHRLFGLFGGFSEAAYLSDIWYYYLPGNMSQWYLVYLMGALVVCLGIGRLSDRAANIMKTKIAKRGMV